MAAVVEWAAVAQAVVVRMGVGTVAEVQVVVATAEAVAAAVGMGAAGLAGAGTAAAISVAAEKEVGAPAAEGAMMADPCAQVQTVGTGLAAAGLRVAEWVKVATRAVAVTAAAR